MKLKTATKRCVGPFSENVSPVTEKYLFMVGREGKFM